MSLDRRFSETRSPRGVLSYLAPLVVASDPRRVNELRVDIWSDIACPWCYVGKRRFESALQRFPQRDQVEVVWRAFELDPSAPRRRERGVSYAARLAKKYGVPLAHAEAMIRNMTEVAAQDGLSIDFDRVQSGNTFDAHRLLHLAAERGVQDAVKERLLFAYFSEAEPIGEPEVLARLAPQAGLDEKEVRATLASDAYAREVRNDEAQAQSLGIRGVPFFVLAERYGVSGAQPADVLLQVLGEVWRDVAPQERGEVDGPVCGPDGC
jgi:predicted DsbA family dithiol-disulfide isomerase